MHDNQDVLKIEIERLEQKAVGLLRHGDTTENRARVEGLLEAVDHLRTWLASGGDEPAAELIARLLVIAGTATEAAKAAGKRSAEEGRRRGLWRGVFLIAELLEVRVFDATDGRRQQRCRGLTKAGYRCPRILHGDALYCWQHADQAPAEPTLAELQVEIWG